LALELDQYVRNVGNRVQRVDQIALERINKEKEANLTPEKSDQ